MIIRNAIIDDLDNIKEIYAHAREFMKQTNNSTQWGDHKPSLDQIKCDIEKNKSFVCINDENEIVGVFYFNIEEDITYNYIEGKWLNSEEYGVIHRIAVKENTKGIGTFCIRWAINRCNNLRIDTHENNIPMRSLLKKLGFDYCGIIYLLDKSPRLAYHKICKEKE